MMFHCDCDMNYCDATDEAYLKGLLAGDDEWPDRASFTCDNCDKSINLSNDNASDLFTWLGLSTEPIGHIQASDLVARCRRRLWNERRNEDAGVDSEIITQPGKATLYYLGRDPGYLRRQTERLLKVAEAAGGNLVSWS